MSHLRAPAARADRREGGRHGRPVARTAPSLPETHIRPHLMRLAVLPPVAVALGAAAAVLFTVRSTHVPPSPALFAVLAGAVSVTLAAVVIAAVAARRAARSVQERVDALRRGSTRREAELRALVDTLRRGEAPPRRKSRGAPPADADDFELLAADLARAHDGAVASVVQAAQLSSQTGSEQKLEVFVNLARRLQSLVHREIAILDDLENELEDPELLKGLFQVDHLATRIRRHAENLAVLGGAVSRRQWSNPVPMTEVLRSAVAEVEQYSRVKLVPPAEGTLRGHAVADVIHLLAELVENATVFSAPHTQVLLRAGLVTSGLAVEVEDRGLGMPVEEQTRMNALLADPDQVHVASLLADGRIGLYVVSQLARRHGITVRLQSNIYGGVQAVLVVPQALLGAPPNDPDRSDTPMAGYDTGGAPQSAYGAPGSGSDGTYDTDGAGATYATGGVAGTYGGGPPVGGTYGTAGVPVPYDTGSALLGYESGSALPGHESGSALLGHEKGGALLPHDTGSAPLGHDTGSPLPPQAAGGAPVVDPRGAAEPLPVRDLHEQRPTPAAATPGIRAEDRSFLVEHATTPLTPRSGPVRGTMGRPQLPRRRAQHHLAPQLRERPALRDDADGTEGHDPGLMAAYQRGVSLAEAQHGGHQPDPPSRPPYPGPTPLAPVPRQAPLPSRTAVHPAFRHDGSAPAG
ncbi:ATP-binding protein [Streptomyces sp. NPDC048290]|uniref:sensor histidine kinase n=1 Tax=Streptomyces sp. NPDC048290 TaxID=3155811 RepID=UPI003444E47F